MLVSAKHQHESAIGIPMSLPSWTSLSPPSPSHASRLLKSHTANSHWLPILHMVMYMFPCYSLQTPHPLLPPPHHVCSLCLCPLCCPANRLISTVFLYALYIYICVNIQYLFLTTSLCIICSRFILWVSFDDCSIINKLFLFSKAPRSPGLPYRREGMWGSDPTLAIEVRASDKPHHCHLGAC